MIKYVFGNSKYDVLTDIYLLLLDQILLILLQ